MTTFHKANTINVKKVDSLLKAITNFSKNEVTSKLKPKYLAESEKKFLNEMQADARWHYLTVFNTFIYLYDTKCVKFDSDKDVSYNVKEIDYPAI